MLTKEKKVQKSKEKKERQKSKDTKINFTFFTDKKCDEKKFSRQAHGRRARRKHSLRYIVTITRILHFGIRLHL